MERASLINPSIHIHTHSHFCSLFLSPFRPFVRIKHLLLFWNYFLHLRMCVCSSWLDWVEYLRLPVYHRVSSILIVVEKIVLYASKPRQSAIWLKWNAVFQVISLEYYAHLHKHENVFGLFFFLVQRTTHTLTHTRICYTIKTFSRHRRIPHFIQMYL